MPGGFLAGDEHATHVDGQGSVEVLHAELVERCDGQHAGVVDQNVQPAQGFGGGLHGLADGFLIGAVCANGQCPSAIGIDAVLNLQCVDFRIHVGKRDGRAFLGQAVDDGCANAPRAALHQSDFASEFEVFDHDVLRWAGLGQARSRLRLRPE